jgi:biotin transport system substrate-specific component
MILTNARRIVSLQQLARLGTILAFAALTGLAARVTIFLPFTPVPITLQVLAVLLAGLVLGSRVGALSQLAYLAAVTTGLPLDARMLGPAVWLQPTAGYLVGFVVGAFAAGWVWEHASSRFPGAAFVACAVGIAGIYLPGALWLTVFFLHGDLIKGVLLGVAPFLVIDSLKAAAAAALAEIGRGALRRLPGERL